MLSSRNIKILKIIIGEYIETGQVLGSKLLLQKHKLGISPATVRNDMVKLEELDLVFQPYNSAGRLPTSKGLRAYVDYLIQQTPKNLFCEIHKGEKQVKNILDFGNNISFELSKASQEIGFFIVPKLSIVSYSGAGIFLENNHKRLGDSIFCIIKMLDDKDSFSKFILELPLINDINLFIGEENILPFLKNYTIIVKKINIQNSECFFGVIGSLKMNYSFNISLVSGII